MQETSQIRWLMYCKSAICKSGQFEFDSVINWSLFQYNVLNLTRLPSKEHIRWQQTRKLLPYRESTRIILF